MVSAALTGFATALSLIAAIGAQNAFVLRQGLRREHVLGVVFVCAGSDAVLISAGVAGFGQLIELAPWITRLMLILGAVFLFVYGGLRFRAAFRGGAALMPSAQKSAALIPTLVSCALLTWTNPHVYLDTVILLGAVSAQYTPFEWSFGLGACLASFTFFIALGYGARLLAPLLQKPRSWVVLEVIIGAMMWGLAVILLRGA